jgi:hypothetical protein
MTSEIPRVLTADTSKKPFLTNPGAIFRGILAQTPHFSHFRVLAALWRSLPAIVPLCGTTAGALVPFAVTGCSTLSSQPVIVQISDPSPSSSQHRAPERQRNVWIAPQAIDNEILQHEQMVTFVEKPAAWQLPSTIEPNTISRPDLPLEQGEYDAEPLKHQQEIIADTQAQVRALNEEMEHLKVQAQKAIETKDTQVNDLSEQLKATQRQLGDASQKLADIEATEKRKQEEVAKRAKKAWWRIWK